MVDWEISLCLPPITSIKTCGRLGNIPLLTTYHKYQDMWQIGKYPFAHHIPQVLSSMCSKHVADWEISLCLPPITSIKSVRGAPWSAANRLHGQRTGAFSWRPVFGLSRKTDQFQLDPTQNCAPGWWYDQV